MFPLCSDFGRCRVCNSEQLRPLHVYTNKGRRAARSSELVLLGCVRCGVVWSHPLPSDEELDAFYSGPDGWEQKARSIDEPKERSIVSESLERKRRRYARELALLLPHLRPPTAATGGTPRVLDFGCGIGGWLEAFRDCGWETYGIEPGAKARRLIASRHTLLDQIPEEPQFDLVILSQVLEHLAHPFEVLSRLAAATVFEGEVFISVPDLTRLPRHLKFSYVKGDVHIFSYTYTGLGSLLARAGYRAVAHFDSPEWDAVYLGEEARLKVLARRDPHIAFPIADEPLAEARQSLLDYGREVEKLIASGAVDKRPKPPKESKPPKPAPEERPRARNPAGQ